jgi:hypothetical protein
VLLDGLMSCGRSVKLVRVGVGVSSTLTVVVLFISLRSRQNANRPYTIDITNESPIPVQLEYRFDWRALATTSASPARERGAQLSRPASFRSVLREGDSSQSPQRTTIKPRIRLGKARDDLGRVLSAHVPGVTKGRSRSRYRVLTPADRPRTDGLSAEAPARGNEEPF